MEITNIEVIPTTELLVGDKIPMAGTARGYADVLAIVTETRFGAPITILRLFETSTPVGDLTYSIEWLGETIRVFREPSAAADVRSTLDDVHALSLARVVDHTYHSSGRAFYIVECAACGSVLNSGHHYYDRYFAEDLAEDHNATHHAPAPTTRPTREHANGSCCGDCLMLLANGETDPNLSEEETAAYLAAVDTGCAGTSDVTLGRMFGEDGCEHTSELWHAGDSNYQEEHTVECEQLGFRWSRCDVCQRPNNAGERYAVTFWLNEEPSRSTQDDFGFPRELAQSEPAQESQSQDDVAADDALLNSRVIDVGNVGSHEPASEPAPTPTPTRYWSAGSNTAGYSPEGDVVSFDDFDAAREYMLDELTRAADHAAQDEDNEESDEIAAEFAAARDNLNEADAANWLYYVDAWHTEHSLDTAYWITELAAPDVVVCRDCGTLMDEPACWCCGSTRGIAGDQYETRDNLVSDEDYVDEFVSSYVTCALWSSTYDTSIDEQGNERDDNETLPMDDDYDASDIAPASLASMREECRVFIEANSDDLRETMNATETYHGAGLVAMTRPMGYDAGRAGHDFWLTRNGHGAGFWDRGLGAVGDRLSAASKVYGSSDLYVGDDGLVYVS